MKNRGFTLIELLVVIAVIGLLAAVILASLNSARDKGKVASIKSNLKNLGSQAELYYDSHNTYAGLCSPDNSAIDASIQPFIDALKNIAGGTNVKCFVHAPEVTNYYANDMMENRNFAVAVAFNDVHYAVDNMGVVTFDTKNSVSGGQASGGLTFAQNTCANKGKHLPSMEQLKTFADIYYGIAGPDGLYWGPYWSRSLSPALSTSGYYVFFNNGVVTRNLSSTVGRYVLCVS